MEKDTKLKKDVKPNIKLKSEQSFRHDLYKLKIGTSKKNISWQKHQPNLVDVEHTHFYHSVNMRGEPNKNSIEISGHFHEVSTTVMPNGDMTASCGPPMKKVLKETPNGKILTMIEPVKYVDANTGKTIYDQHLHEIEYIGSEFLSQEIIKQKQQADSKKLAEMMQPAQVEDNAS